MKTDKEKLLALADSLEWQDIETAPKDGRRVLIYSNKHGGMQIARWNRHTETWQPRMGVNCVDETHWMPLPTGEAAAVIRELVKALEDIRCHCIGDGLPQQRAYTAMKKAAEQIGHEND